MINARLTLQIKFFFYIKFQNIVLLSKVHLKKNYFKVITLICKDNCVTTKFLYSSVFFLHIILHSHHNGAQDIPASAATSTRGPGKVEIFAHNVHRWRLLFAAANAICTTTNTTTAARRRLLLTAAGWAGRRIAAGGG